MVIISSYFLVVHGMVLQALGQRSHSRFKILFIRQRRKALSFLCADICLWAIQALVPADDCYRCCMADSRALRVNWNTLGARKSSLYWFCYISPGTKVCGKKPNAVLGQLSRWLSSRRPVPLQATPKGLLHLFVLWATRSIPLYISWKFILKPAGFKINFQYIIGHWGTLEVYFPF